MEPIETLADAVEAHDVLLFLYGTPDAPDDPASAAGVDMLRFLRIEFASVDLSAHAGLPDALIPLSKGFATPVLFINGVVFADLFTMLDYAKTGRLGPFLDAQNVSYSRAALWALRAT